MIMFDGYITGEAAERFFEKNRSYERTMLFLGITTACLCFLPLVIANNWMPILLGIYVAEICAIFIGVHIPKSAKEKEAITPKSITIENGNIVCVTNRKTETRCIADVKEVQDCKTYYEVVFKFGKSSINFICQKNLLVQGTIEEFEALFEGKITDLTSYFE